MASHLTLVTAGHDREIQIAEAKAIVTDLRTALGVAERLLARLRAPTESVRTRTVEARNLTPGDVVIGPYAHPVEVRSVSFEMGVCLVGFAGFLPVPFAPSMPVEVRA